MVKWTLRLLVPALAALQAAGAMSQAFPARPVKLVVPYTAGGSGDIVARAIAQKLSETWKQQVVVDNRPGANGNIGAEAVARAPADGYTMLLASDIQLSISPHLYRKLPFDPVKDFDPVTLVATVDLVLAAHPSVAANNARELAALAKSSGSRLNYGSTGPGSTHHLAIETLKRMGGFDLVHVPYKGSSQALPDLISGQIQVMLLGVPQTLPHLKAGKLKALGVGGSTRLAALPDVPTIAEAGFAGFEANNLWHLMVPAGTPRDIVARTQRDVAEVLKLPDVRERFLATGLTPVGSTPEQLAERIRSDSARWGRAIQELGVRVDD